MCRQVRLQRRPVLHNLLLRRMEQGFAHALLLGQLEHHVTSQLQVFHILISAE
jgi:hypothetical protein